MAALAAARYAREVEDTRYQRAMAAFDRENAADPNLEHEAGVDHPRELLQARRYTRWLERMYPEASLPLRLAVRCQHIRRWERPRSDYPEGRIGYLRWRKDLARFHAETAARILNEVGYDSEIIEKVRQLNLKKELKTDPEAQALEDVLCLSFIEHELEAFSAKHDAEKLSEIIRKTWNKMSEKARAVALALPLAAAVRERIERALAAESTSDFKPV